MWWHHIKDKKKFDNVKTTVFGEATITFRVKVPVVVGHPVYLHFKITNIVIKISYEFIWDIYADQKKLIKISNDNMWIIISQVMQGWNKFNTNISLYESLWERWLQEVKIEIVINRCERPLI